MKPKTDLTLIIMSAGLGSRYGGSKQVDRIGPDGEILMQYSVFDAIRAGFGKIVFVIKPEHRELIEGICLPYAGSGVEFCFVYQEFSSIPSFYSIPKERIKPFGTVHALLCAAEAVSSPFAVINADDFYGASAFELMRSALSSLRERQAVAVAYPLKNTLSKHGSVTRGVCEVESGLLTQVRETYSVCTDSDGIIRGDGGCELDGDTPVSMNFWGFHPDIFASLKAEFDRFLLSIPKGDIKAEYVLSTFIDGMIKSGSLTIRLLSTNAEWFGVTHREDRPLVAERLAKMKHDGVYPAGLLI